MSPDVHDAQMRVDSCWTVGSRPSSDAHRRLAFAGPRRR